MMNVLWLSLAVMAGATLAVHLGLTEAIGRVVLKAARCNQCTTFWTVWVFLVSIRLDPARAAMIAIAMAYASNWFAILLIRLQKIYEKLWERMK